MTTLRIEHPIHEFAVWKQAFDRDPIGRERSGVRRYRVLRPLDDPKYVLIDLEFDNAQAAEAAEAAEAALAALRELWRSPAAVPALGGAPQTRIVEVVEQKEY